MLKIKSKKGVALIFLMELLLLVMFITLIFLSAGRLISNDAKYYDLSVENLASFLERIPTIEGNFYYEFQFYNASDVQVTSDKVFLRQAGKSAYDHSSTYLTKSEYSKEFELKNVTSIYFYKIGKELSVFSEPNKEYDLRLNEVEPISYDKPRISYVNSQGQTYSLANQINQYNSKISSSQQVQLTHSYGIANHPYNNISIQYSINSKAFAHDLFNSIVETMAFYNESPKIALYPVSGSNEVNLVIHSNDVDLITYTNTGVEGLLS